LLFTERFKFNFLKNLFGPHRHETD
jgi:hypothetical protein